MTVKKIGDWCAWYTPFDELFSGEILADEGDRWLIRRAFGGVCSLLKSEIAY